MMRDGTTDKIDITKVAKTVASEWKNMSDAEKKVSIVALYVND